MPAAPWRPWNKSDKVELMAACMNPGYNDNPSQQITNARIGCLAATDFFSVYFTVHVQPSTENPQTRITRELFRSYCTEIPAPGKVFFTADLVGSELWSMPIGVRIVEQEFVGDDESSPESFKDLRTLSEIPAKSYPHGTIELHFELDKNGDYAIYLIRGREETVSGEDKLRIPLKVGVASGAKHSMTRIFNILIIASALAVIAFISFRNIRTHKSI